MNLNEKPIDAVNRKYQEVKKGWVLSYGCGGLSAGCLGPWNRVTA
jgi:hypothetical protein